MDFSEYLNDLPLLHTWNNGETWNTGGFNRSQLRKMHDLVESRYEGRSVSVIESGAGNSTITFLHLDLNRLVSIAPSRSLENRIREYCVTHNIDAAPLDFRADRSECQLPAIALSTATPNFDVALIDGGHGWPTVFVDFCYFNMMLGTGGLLLLDDTQLHSVAELSRLLDKQVEYELRDRWGKLEVWEKMSDEKFFADHNKQPYIVEKSRDDLTT